MNESIHGERTASELQDRVTELIEQQTAISEVLRAIASSSHDLQPIFDAIVGSATRLYRADAGSLRLSEEGGLRLDDDIRHSQAGHRYKHVLLVSVDGMHSIDLSRWIESHPNGNFAKLAHNGVVYPNAYTTAPSDSYPGMLAQVTGGTPKSGGLFYDDSYDRTEYPAKAFYTSKSLSDPGCVGAPGTEVTASGSRSIPTNMFAPTRSSRSSRPRECALSGRVSSEGWHVQQATNLPG